MERIVTERLTLEPMCCAEMAAHAAACREADPELSAAYREMLDGCRANPGQWLWYTAWKMLLRDGTEIGDACFKGLSADGRAEIGYEIGAAYWGRGYATEGAAALCRWALENGARRRRRRTPRPCACWKSWAFARREKRARRGRGLRLRENKTGGICAVKRCIAMAGIA